MLQTAPDTAIARWLTTVNQSALRDIHAALLRPGVLSLALGMPDPRLFPTQALTDAAARVLDDAGTLQYALPFPPLKQQIVELMKRRGVTCTADQVFLTAGAQQGMDLLVRLLLEPQASVLLERIVYDGIQLAIRPFDAEPLVVPSDPQNGIDVEAVERLLKSGIQPAFLYTIADGHNPTGSTMPLESRTRLVRAASQYGVPILEDDAYGFLQYENALPPLRQLEPDWVFYIGSFSKILAPALRVGWLIVPEHLTQKLSVLKQLSDIDVSSFGQRLVSEFLRSANLGRHVASLCREYAARRDAMLRALARHMPAGTRWNVPGGGFFVWVELPGGTHARAFLRFAAETERVAFVPGEGFSVRADSYAKRCIRLNFSNCGPDRIEEGVKRIGRALRQWSGAGRRPALISAAS